MVDWRRFPLPRRAKWSWEGLQATIEDDGDNITVTLTSRGDVFMIALKRELYPSRAYFVQDVAGTGFANTENFGKGAGRFLANTTIQYLQALADPEYLTIRGELFHVEEADPPGHADERKRFFETLGATFSGTKAVACVTDLVTIPCPLPFLRRGEPLIVPLDQFRWEEQRK